MVEKTNSPKMPVKCSVENCSYNRSRMCHADEIEVSAMGDGKAKTVDGTCCSTFENKVDM